MNSRNTTLAEELIQINDQLNSQIPMKPFDELTVLEKIAVAFDTLPAWYRFHAIVKKHDINKIMMVLHDPDHEKELDIKTKERELALHKLQLGQEKWNKSEWKNLWNFTYPSQG